MRVLVVTNMYPGPGAASWQGVFIKEQLEALVSTSDIRAEIVFVQGSTTGGSSVKAYLKAFFELYSLKRNNNFDVTWAHHSFCVFVAYLLRYERIVYTLHEGHSATGIKAWIIWIAIRLSQTVIYVNHSGFITSSVSSKFWIPCGVKLARFKLGSQAECKKKLGLSNSHFNVLFPACPNRPEKNAKFVKEFIAQRGPWVNKERINFIFGGDIEYEEMPIWMKSADCLVSCSIFESDGMVFKEAMAVNLPVITFNVGNAKIYFGDGTAGTIIQDSFDAFQDALTDWKMKGRSKGADKLLALKMDTISTAGKLSDALEKVSQLSSTN